MKASDYIVEFLFAQGVTVVFELVGGMITHLVDSLNLQGKIQIITVHHEQAAAFAAEGAARMTGIPGVALATSGPGATNLITGIGSCFFDSYPAIFITGQVNRNEQKGARNIRQLGFQETDIVSIVAPITKAAWRVNSPDELPDLLEAAFKLSCSGRPGPVLLDIPMDVQRADITRPVQHLVFDQGKSALEIIPTVLADLKQAKKPLILAGGGIRSAQVSAEFRKFVELVKAPVVNSLLAVDALPYDHPLRVGLLGSYGNRWANLAVSRSDFLLVLGSRLDIRQTGANTTAFKGDRKIYHVDCDPGELNNRVQGCFPVLAHLRTFLTQAIESASGQHFQPNQEWLAEIENLRSEWPDIAELKNTPGINPNVLMHLISKVSEQAAAIVVDVGNHQMWAAQSLDIGINQRFITSGGMGAMGFALPTAIGVSLTSPGKPVVLIAGDGGFQLNIQELQTVVRNALPLKMIIINNHSLGMVRQFQQSYFHERYQSTYWGYSTPDFTQVARAYGIAAHPIVNPEDIQSGLELLWRDPEAPFLLDVFIDPFTNAYPKLAFGHTIAEMEPFVKPLDMEGT